MKAPGHVLAEGGFVQRHHGLNALVRQREHGRGARHASGRVIVHGQQRQRLAVIEPFPGRVLVRHFVRDLAHQHAAAKVVLPRGNAHGAARGGKTAVGGHQQARGVRGAIGQRELRAFGPAAHLRGGLPRQQGDAAMRAGGGLHFGQRGAADEVVGNQPAQLVAPGETVADLHGKGRFAIEYPRIAQW